MILFRDVHKTFGSRKILNGISFEVKKSEIVFLLGTSGTGKSVCLKHMVGLIRPDRGEILIDGVDVPKLSEEELSPIRRRCGMVFQQPALFDSLTIFENVAFGARRHLTMEENELKKHVAETLLKVGLSDIEEKLPTQISYGMQKRVSLARTLAVKPDILLFDEPTTGLDPQTTRAINHLIRDLSRLLQTTSVIVSHDMQCALEIADRIIVLDKGTVVEMGTPEQLKKSSVPLVQDFLAEV